jgi:hypothetical protein
MGHFGNTLEKEGKKQFWKKERSLTKKDLKGK